MQSVSPSEHISLSPLKEDLKSYSFRKLHLDVVAGLTVALMTIPQAMAYAVLAGLPLSCGLFSAVFGGFFAALLGSSRHLVVGPTNAIAILVQAGTAEILYTFYRDVTGPARELLAVQVLAQLTLLVGIFQVLAAVFKLGRLTQFVSQAVVVGYMTGTAVALVVSQMFVFLGMEAPPGVLSLYHKVLYIIQHPQDYHWPTIWIGLASLIFLIGMKRVRWPNAAAALMLVIAGATIYFLALSAYPWPDMLDPYAEEYVTKIRLVGMEGKIFGLLPAMAWPGLEPMILSKLITIAFAIALLGMLESSAVSKSIAAESGQTLAINQEIFGLGVGNTLAAFFGGMPAAGSPSRSLLNYRSGGVTRFAAIFSAAVVFLIAFTLGYFISFIPLAVLAALSFVTAAGLVNVRCVMMCLKATRSDAFVLIMTVASCFFFSVDIAFYIGIVLSVIFYLNKASHPQLFEYASRDVAIEPLRDTGILVINVHGELFFGAADLFQSALKALADRDDQLRVIILRLKHARDIDATTCIALLHLYRYLRGQKMHLLVCSIPEGPWHVMLNSGVIDEVGSENFFIHDWKAPSASMDQALVRARAVLRQDESAGHSACPSAQPVCRDSLTVVHVTAALD